LAYIYADDASERTYHFNECENVLFHAGSGQTIWATAGDFTMIIPKGIGARVVRGKILSAEDAEAEKERQQAQAEAKADKEAEEEG